jgi:EAL domain-containing protein (putative c-di-GMP-specific phosphodiesterase class I)
MDVFEDFDLRKAINEGEFVPYFQPKVDLRTGRVVGFEALARWEHPERGLLPPEEFIPIIEKAGLIGIFTERLLHKVFEIAHQILPDPIFISVNVSPLQMREGTLAELIRRVGEEKALPLRRLIVEITESALVVLKHRESILTLQCRGLTELFVTRNQSSRFTPRSLWMRMFSMCALLTIHEFASSRANWPQLLSK